MTTTDRTIRVRTWVSARELPEFLAERARRAERHKVADLARNQRHLESRVRDLEDNTYNYDEVKALVLDYFTHVGPCSVERLARVLGYGTSIIREACDELVAEGEIGPAAKG